MTATNGNALPHSTPEAQGIRSRDLLHFFDAVEKAGLEQHHFLLYRNGYILAEASWWPYTPGLRHMQHSLTKSFVSAGVGLAYDEQLLSLDDKVISFFPDELPAQIDDNLRAMTVRHLLLMSTGHGAGISGGAWRPIPTSWVAEFFKQPVPNTPGRSFVYSSASSYMLSAIVQRVTGRRLSEYMEEKFFRPLGIVDVQWDSCPHGISSGGNGITCSTLDIAKLGIVHLNGGLWNGKRILSEEWVRLATHPHLKNVKLGGFDGKVLLPADAPDPRGVARTREGYGFHWWAGPDGSYHALGVFGQYSIVLPKKQAVIALNSALHLRNDTLTDLVWSHLVPAMQPHALPEDKVAFTELKARLEGTRLLAVPPETDSPLAKTISGKVFAMEPNEDSVESIRLRFEGKTSFFEMKDHRGTHIIEAGLGHPVSGATSMTGNYLHHEYQRDDEPMLAMAQWIDKQTLQFTWSFVETTFRDTVTCFFPDSQTLQFNRRVNVNSMAMERPLLTGRTS